MSRNTHTHFDIFNKQSLDILIKGLGCPFTLQLVEGGEGMWQEGTRREREKEKISVQRNEGGREGGKEEENKRKQT